MSPLPKDLQDRRVEITGPVDRKMVINAMNSGASVFMADFEDSNAPVWYVPTHSTLSASERQGSRGSAHAPASRLAYKLAAIDP